MKKTLSHILGFFLAALIVHPAIDYRIPMLVNSWHWLFIVVMSALLGFQLLQTSIHPALKTLSVYLFVNAFFSQVPYLGFNSYIVTVFGFYFYLLAQKTENEIMLRWIETAFWVQVCLSIFQLADMDKLLCFDRAFELDETTLQVKPITTDIPKFVMFGTVMQYMRYASLLAVMAPFIIMRDKRYLILIVLLCGLTSSSTFALSLVAGAAVYFGLKVKNWKTFFFIHGPILLLAAGLYAAWDWGSFRGAIIPSNGGRLITWLVILKTWVMDTAHSVKVDPWGLTGPINWQWVFLGHGADTFLPLFPIYKHDMNPFPQAHNSWFQMLWEIGSIGTGLALWYLGSLVVRLYKCRLFLLLGGLACFGVNMFFAFPDRMMQTIFLMIYYFAFCEIEIGKNFWRSVNYERN